MERGFSEREKKGERVESRPAPQGPGATNRERVRTLLLPEALWPLLLWLFPLLPHHPLHLPSPLSPILLSALLSPSRSQHCPGPDLNLPIPRPSPTFLVRGGPSSVTNELKVAIAAH